MTSSSPIGFLESNDEFRRRCGDHIHHTVAKRLSDSGVLGSVRSCLSIGVGDGWIDDLMISTCIPPPPRGSLTRFVGIDPDRQMCDALSERMAYRFPQIQTSIHCCRIQDWDANDNEVSEKFDLIIFYEMLYYFDEKDLTDLLRRSVTKWLSPGGHVLISIDRSSASSFYLSVVRNLWPDECRSVPDADMIELVVNRNLEGIAAIERWYEYQYDIDVREPYDDAYLNIFTYQVCERSLSPDKTCLERVRQSIREVVNGQTTYVENGCVLLISHK